MGSSNENSGFGPVLNPWDRSRCSRRFVSGSAARRRSPPGPLHGRSGTDTGGSIRQPAALCGIVGMKPTYGACSRYGMIAFASSLDQAGPLTRDVTDAALLFRHMIGQDPCDSTSLEFPGEVAIPTADDLKGILLARGTRRSWTGPDGGVEPGVRESFEQVLRLAEGLGAQIEPCRLPHAPHALSAYYLIAPAEASANLARYDGVRYGLRVGAEEGLIHMYEATRAAGFGPEVKRRIMLGTYALSSGYYDAYYGTAQVEGSTKISEDFRNAFERFDFIVTPPSPWTAFEHRRQERRSARDVSERLLHGPDVTRGHPRDLDSIGSERRPAGRFPARRAGVLREPHARRRVRARAGDRALMEAGPACEPLV